MNATVVVSCYNQQKYISECLESILTQATSFDFEILVSDDCSTDNTPNILREFALNNPGKIKLILRSENVGPAQNYIFAHDSATGDIIFHFDGDDVMFPGKLQAQFDQFSKNKELSLCLHRATYFTDYNDFRPTGSLGGDDAPEMVPFSIEDLALWGTIAVHSSYAYRRSSRTVHGLQREFMEWFFAMDSLANGSGVYINQILTGYRYNPNGTSYLSTPRGKKKSYLLYFNDLYIYFESLKQYRNQLYANAFVTFLGMSLNGKHFDKKVTCFLIKNIKYLRPRLILITFKTRKSVQPKGVR